MDVEGTVVNVETPVLIIGYGENVVDVESTVCLGVVGGTFEGGSERRLERKASKWCMITSLDPLKRATRCMPSPDT